MFAKSLCMGAVRMYLPQSTAFTVTRLAWVSMVKASEMQLPYVDFFLSDAKINLKDEESF